MVIEFVTSQCNKSHGLAQASFLWGTVAQASDVAQKSLVKVVKAKNLAELLY